LATQRDQVNAGLLTHNPGVEPLLASEVGPLNVDIPNRRGAKRATLSVARKLARQAYHTLRELGDQALRPVSLQPLA